MSQREEPPELLHFVHTRAHVMVAGVERGPDGGSVAYEDRTLSCLYGEDALRESAGAASRGRPCLAAFPPPA